MKKIYIHKSNKNLEQYILWGENNISSEERVLQINLKQARNLAVQEYTRKRNHRRAFVIRK